MSDFREGKVVAIDRGKSGSGKRGRWTSYKVTLLTKTGSELWFYYMDPGDFAKEMEAVSPGDMLKVVGSMNGKFFNPEKIVAHGQGNGDTSGGGGATQSSGSGKTVPSGSFRKPAEMIRQDCVGAAVALYNGYMAAGILKKTSDVDQIKFDVLDLAGEFEAFVTGATVEDNPTSSSEDLGVPSNNNEDDDIPF